MEKRTILAIVLSLAVLLGFQYFFPPAHPPQKAPAKVSAQTASETATIPAGDKAATGSEAEPPAPAAEPAKTPVPVVEEGELVVVQTPLYRAEFDTVGGRLKAFYLKHYKTENKPGSPELNLVTVTKTGPWPLTGAVKLEGRWQPDERLHFKPAARALEVEEAGKELVFEAPLGAGRTLLKKFNFQPGSYVIGITYEVLAETGPAPALEGVRVNWVHSSKGQKKSRYVYNGVIGYVNDKLFKPGKKDKEIARQEIAGQINWFGYTSKYFISALLIPENGKFTATRGIINRDGSADDGNLTVTFEVDGSNRLRAYIGPKEGDRLQALGLKLEASIEYGWFGIIARPLVWLLHFLYQYVHNYGIAIIILTILIKLVFYPLSQKSYKSMSQMKKVQPKLAKLKEKYKDDKARLNKEMMDLYRTHKVNPFGGCLPMVVQIPVFFALYRALMVAIELRHAPFFFWITDLSAKDPYYVTPLIMGATMFLQQKMTPTAGGDAMQAKLMLFMPIIFTFMFLNFPSGLVLYWLVNNILSIGQQYLVMRQVEPAK